jgi:hypothetical protein
VASLSLPVALPEAAAWSALPFIPALGIDIGATVQEKTDCGFIAASLGGCLERIAILPALGIDIGATVQEKTDCGFIAASVAAAWSALP